MNIDFDALVAVVTIVSVILAVGMLLIDLRSMKARVDVYREAASEVPVLLKRDIGLILGLAILGLQGFVLRGILAFLGIEQMTGLPRFAYSIESALVVLVPLAYWTKVELRDINDYRVK